MEGLSKLLYHVGTADDDGTTLSGAFFTPALMQNVNSPHAHTTGVTINTSWHPSPAQTPKQAMDQINSMDFHRVHCSGSEPMGRQKTDDFFKKGGENTRQETFHQGMWKPKHHTAQFNAFPRVSSQEKALQSISQCPSPQGISVCKVTCSAKRQVKMNMQAAAKKSTYLEAKRDWKHLPGFLNPQKSSVQGCGNLGASHRAVFLTAAVKTENAFSGMGSGQINWNHLDEKLWALKTLLNKFG
ncbi:hypothetical protein BTVI_10868 [Pitangus sulphuratus]|nr:hypothetical protein BTVI_10868 [Pitangus sulphuratus]